jgi:phosphoenolpyruvate-protein kinase (PTS system EI component)
MINGIGVSEGIVTGKILIKKQPVTDISKREILSVDGELDRYSRAIE